MFPLQDHSRYDILAHLCIFCVIKIGHNVQIYMGAWGVECKKNYERHTPSGPPLLQDYIASKYFSYGDKQSEIKVGYVPRSCAEGKAPW